MNLRRKVFLRLAALVSLTAISLTALTWGFVTASHRSEMVAREAARTQVLAGHLERLLPWAGRPEITGLLSQFVKKDPLRAYALVTAQGKPVAWSAAGGISGIPSPSEDNEGRTPPGPAIIRDATGRILLDLSAPISGTGALLHIGLDRRAIDRSAQPMLSRIGIVGLGGLFLGLALAGFAARQTAHEVTTLTEALTSAIEDPGSGPVPPPGSASEAKRLVELFNRQMEERRRTAVALEHQKGFLDTVLDALTHPFYVINTSDYSIEIANSAARERGIANGACCYEVTHSRTTPCDGDDHPCPLALLRTGREPMVIEHVHTSPQGELRYLEIHAYPILDETGVLAQMIEYTLDITERKKAEEELRRSQARLERLYSMARLMADNLPDMIWAKDLEGRYLFANRALASELLMAEDTEEPLGKTDAFFADRARARHPDEPDWYTLGEVCGSSDARVLETRAPMQFDETGRVNGRFVWLDVRKAPLFDRNGALIGTVGSARDVTKERSRDEERRRLQAAVEQAEMGVLILDAEGRVVYANPAYGEITGYSPEEVIGRGMDFIRSQYEKAGDFEEMQALLSMGKAWRGRVYKRRKDGTVYVQGELVAPVRDAEGAIINIMSYLRDVSSEVDLEARYLQAQKLESVGRLAGGIAHDFNNLLGAVRAYAELLQMELDQCGAVHEYVEEILAATEHGARLTRQLLAFARRQPAAPRALDLNKVVSDFEGMLGQLIGEDVQLTTELEAGLPPVVADPAQIEQVLANLVVNARDAMPQGGRVRITTRAVEDAGADTAAEQGPGHWVALSVSDTGVGMTDEVLEHIFEPFFTTKETGKGTGLGLSTCFGIVSEAGGRITVESRPGAGTTMTVYLPQAGDEPTPGIEEPVIPEMCGGTETILFVEDELKLRQAVAKELRALGYTIIEAGDGLDALELWHANAGTIDLLLTDEVMPHMAGSELARQLRELEPGLKVILVSGYIGEAPEGSTDPSSGALIVSKPFSLRALATAIRQAIDGGGDRSRETS
ncbi:MAG: PAS domain-containing protein [Acidobacteria bacterium]|nr:PAS domain-containing protein [Acidobacteriota bacterium]